MEDHWLLGIRHPDHVFLPPGCGEMFYSVTASLLLPVPSQFLLLRAEILHLKDPASCRGSVAAEEGNVGEKSTIAHWFSLCTYVTGAWAQLCY